MNMAWLRCGKPPFYDCCNRFLHASFISWHYERESGPALSHSDTFVPLLDRNRRISARFPSKVHCSGLTAVKLGLNQSEVTNIDVQRNSGMGKVALWLCPENMLDRPLQGNYAAYP